MQRNRSNKRSAKKKNPNRQNARKGSQTALVRALAVKTVVQREVGISSSYIAPYKYSELPTIRFATATQFGSIFYRMNDMLEVFDGVPNNAGKQFPFYTHMAKNYGKSWVLSSSIEVIVQNRELVNSLSVVVFPSIDNSAMGNAFQFIEYASLPGAKKVTLQASTGGMSTHRFLLYSKLNKMFGDQYLMQDQYANTGGVGGIVNLTAVQGFWGIIFYNASGNNTLTSGGITCEVTLRNTVQFFEPVRGLADNALSDDTVKEQLSSQISDLTKKLSLLK